MKPVSPRIRACRTLSGPFLSAFLSAWAISIASGLHIRNFLLLPVFLLLWKFYASLTEQRGVGISGRIPSLIAAALLALTFPLSDGGKYTAAYTSSLFRLGTLLVVFLGLFLLFDRMLLWAQSCLLHGREQRFLYAAVRRDTPADGLTNSDQGSTSAPLSRNSHRASKEIHPSKDFHRQTARGMVGRHLPLVTFLLCVVCYLPFFLYEFPGIMSPDGAWQAEQAIGARPLSNHHPVVHTLLIRLFFRIGSLFTSDVNRALSFYTFAQLLFMAFCAAFCVATIQRLGLRRWVSVAAMLFYALVPFNAVYSVMIGKDTIFSGITLLLVCSILRLVADGYTLDCSARPAPGRAPRKKEPDPLNTPAQHADECGMTASRRLPVKDCVIFAILAILFCLFRSNGWYAFLIMIPFLLIGLRRHLGQILVTLAAVVLSAGIIRGPILDAAGVTQPDFVESICVPLQQVARVVVSDGNISEEEKALIGRVCHYEDIATVYDPTFADMMKEMIRTNGDQACLVAHKADYLRLWLDLGRKNPKLYLSAWVDLTRGYWFPDYDYDSASIDGVFSNVAGLSWHPLIGGSFVKIKEILIKLGTFVPVYGLFWSSGTYSFLLLFAAALSLQQKSARKYFLTLLPMLSLLGTLFLAAPLAAEFRYTYPIVYAFPLWILMPVCAAASHPMPQEEDLHSPAAAARR